MSSDKSLPETSGARGSAVGADGSISAASMPQLSCMQIRQQILRGARLPKVLQNWGATMRTMPTDRSLSARENLWHDSEECQAIDLFLSQSWSSSGWQKYTTILLRFYWKTAFGAGLASTLVCMTFDALGFLPTVLMVRAQRVGWDGTTVWAQVCPWSFVPPMVSLASLFLAPNCKRLQNKLVFLDAACIHQVDQQLKQEGINSLAGFLANSKEFVLLWSRCYFGRAWCVFELAVFVAIHGPDAVRFSPLCVATTLYIVYAMSIATSATISIADCATVVEEAGILRWSLRVLIVLPLPFMTHALRREMEAMRDLESQIEHFDLKNAQCRFPEDLQSIKLSIRVIWGSEERFTLFVRQKLKASIRDVQQQFGYKECLMMTLPVALNSIHNVIAFARTGTNSIDLLFAIVGQASLIFGHIPAVLRLMVILAYSFSKPRESFSAHIAISSGIALAAIIFTFGGVFTLSFVSNRIPFGTLLILIMATLSSCALFRHRLLLDMGKAARTILRVPRSRMAKPNAHQLPQLSATSTQIGRE